MVKGGGELVRERKGDIARGKICDGRRKRRQHEKQGWKAQAVCQKRDIEKIMVGWLGKRYIGMEEEEIQGIGGNGTIE
jgi:hypothetical protein